jgi:hypothetical protein
MNRGYCTTTDGRDIKPFRFDNTREGLDILWSMIVVNENGFGCDIEFYNIRIWFCMPTLH